MLTSDGHEGRTYELGGDDAFTMHEFVAELSRQSDRDVTYQDMSVEAHADVLNGVGLPWPAARILADAEGSIDRGELLVDDGDLRRLIGRPTTPLATVVADALKDRA